MTGRYARLSDGGLVSRASNGDEAALAALYGRYGDDVFDFSLSVVRDPEVASDVLERTFTRAWDRLQSGVRVDIVKAWLFTTARDEALAATPHRTVVDRPAPFAAVDANGSQTDLAVEDEDLVQLVRASAATFSPWNYSLLDLGFRRALGAVDLAAALGAEPIAFRIRLARLRRSLEAPVDAALLIRRGSGCCSALDGMLDAIARPFATDVPWAIRSHLRTCGACQEFLRGFAPPAEIFARLAIVAPSPHVSATVRENVSQHATARRRAHRHGHTVAAWRRGRPRTVALAAAATAAGVGVVVTVTAFTAGTDVDAASGRPTLTKSSATGSSPSPHALLPTAQPPQAPPSASNTGSPSPPVTETDITTPSAPHAGGRTFAWAPVPGAIAYQFHLIRADDLVFSARPASPSVTLPVSWRHQGRDRHLDKGAYRWVVWPIMQGSSEPAAKATVAALLVIN